MPGTHALVLDVEGVIAHPDTARADEELARRWPGVTWDKIHAVRNLPAGYADWLAYSVGAMDGTLYWRNVLDGLGVPSPDGDVELLRAIMRRVWWGRVDRAVLAVAEAIRADGTRLGLLSNSAPEHDERIAELERLVDASHFSHRTGRRKPDAGAYRAAARDLGAAEEACVFVDDKLRNVDAARAVGMRAFVFESAEQLARELGRLGLAAGTATAR
jgi:putative hydrolase of the HAD superfamily